RAAPMRDIPCRRHPSLCSAATSPNRRCQAVRNLEQEENKVRPISRQRRRNSMRSDTRRSFFGRIAALTAFLSAVPKLFAQQTAPGTPAVGPSQNTPTGDAPRRGSSHTHNGIYYFSGTGANDGYPKEDHILVTDSFERHVARTMDALKRSVERAGSNMDSIIHLDVFLCLPLADSVPMP